MLKRLNQTKDLDPSQISNFGGKAQSTASASNNVNSVGFISQVDHQALDIESQTRKIKKRLVSTEHSFDPIALRPNLRRKIKPLSRELTSQLLNKPQPWCKILIMLIEFEQNIFRKIACLN